MPDTMAEYYVAEVSRLVELVKADERYLRMPQKLMPYAKTDIMANLSFLRKHINGMCQIARKVGATDGMIKAALEGNDESMLCPVCATKLVDCPEFKDENGDSFLECPSCNKEKQDD